MKKLYILFMLLPFAAAAQTAAPDTAKAWSRGGAFTVNFNQTNLSNWAAGGQNSIAMNALLNIFINYKRNKTTWDNSAELGYGFLRSGIRGPLYKSDDKIDVTTKAGHHAFYKVYYSALVNFKSQFTEGYNYPNDSVIISEFLAPGYLLGSLGLDYKPNEDMSLFLSPITGKFTFVNNPVLADAGAFGVTPAEYDTAGRLLKHGDRVRKELGAYLTFKYKRKVWENITFLTKLDMFSNYFHDFGNIDVNWDAMLNMKVNKYIAVSINTTLIYDHDIAIPVYKKGTDEIIGYGPRTQFREILAVGFNYKF